MATLSITIDRIRPRGAIQEWCACSSYALGLILGSIVAATLSSRVSARLIVPPGVLILALSSAPSGFADAIMLLDAMRLTAGVAASFIWSAGAAWTVAMALTGATSMTKGSRAA